jgi:hypothetical protein
MGQRRENRGPESRTDLQILDSPDMEVLRAIEARVLTRQRSGASPVFLLGEMPVMLRRLEREDLCTAPIAGLPVLQARGRRLLQVERGELPRPLPG